MTVRINLLKRHTGGKMPRRYCSLSLVLVLVLAFTLGLLIAFFLQ